VRMRPNAESKIINGPRGGRGSQAVASPGSGHVSTCNVLSAIPKQISASTIETDDD
jgi:hypothetical protein